MSRTDRPPLAGPRWEIWMLECGRVPRFPLGAVYAGRHGADTVMLPFGFVLLVSDAHTALVDAGYIDAGPAHDLVVSTGLEASARPAEILAARGIDPSVIETIILTHAHWDHAGGLRDFPRATVWIQGRELASWQDLLARPKRFAFLRSAIVRSDIEHLDELDRAGRLRLVSGAATDILPGIDLLPTLETHTAGHQAVLVRSSAAGGPWLVAGDCVMTLGNLEGPGAAYAPVSNVQGSMVRLLDAYDDMLAVVGGEAQRVLAVHDDDVFGRFPTTRSVGDLRVAAVSVAAETTVRPVAATGSAARREES